MRFGYNLCCCSASHWGLVDTCMKVGSKRCCCPGAWRATREAPTAHCLALHVSLTEREGGVTEISYCLPSIFRSFVEPQPPVYWSNLFYRLAANPQSFARIFPIPTVSHNLEIKKSELLRTPMSLGGIYYIRGTHSYEDPSYTLKPIYYGIFPNRIRSWLLWPLRKHSVEFEVGTLCTPCY